MKSPPTDPSSVTIPGRSRNTDSDRAKCVSLISIINIFIINIYTYNIHAA